MAIWSHQPVEQYSYFSNFELFKNKRTGAAEAAPVFSFSSKNFVVIELL
jgi:hypothetical protein